MNRDIVLSQIYISSVAVSPSIVHLPADAVTLLYWWIRLRTFDAGGGWLVDSIQVQAKLSNTISISHFVSFRCYAEHQHKTEYSNKRFIVPNKFKNPFESLKNIKTKKNCNIHSQSLMNKIRNIHWIEIHTTQLSSTHSACWKNHLKIISFLFLLFFCSGSDSDSVADADAAAYPLSSTNDVICWHFGCWINQLKN